MPVLCVSLSLTVTNSSNCCVPVSVCSWHRGRECQTPSVSPETTCTIIKGCGPLIEDLDRILTILSLSPDKYLI